MKQLLGLLLALVTTLAVAPRTSWADDVDLAASSLYYNPDTDEVSTTVTLSYHGTLPEGTHFRVALMDGTTQVGELEYEVYADAYSLCEFSGWFCNGTCQPVTVIITPGPYIVQFNGNCLPRGWGCRCSIPLIRSVGVGEIEEGHTITMVVDADDDVSEVVETNNEVQFQIDDPWG